MQFPGAVRKKKNKKVRMTPVDWVTEMTVTERVWANLLSDVEHELQHEHLRRPPTAEPMASGKKVEVVQWRLSRLREELSMLWQHSSHSGLTGPQLASMLRRIQDAQADFAAHRQHLDLWIGRRHIWEAQWGERARRKQEMEAAEKAREAEMMLSSSDEEDQAADQGPEPRYRGIERGESEQDPDALPLVTDAQYTFGRSMAPKTGSPASTKTKKDKMEAIKPGFEPETLTIHDPGKSGKGGEREKEKRGIDGRKRRRGSMWRDAEALSNFMAEQKKVRHHGEKWTGWDHRWHRTKDLLFMEAFEVGNSALLACLRGSVQHAKRADQHGKITIWILQAAGLPAGEEVGDDNDPYCIVYWRGVRIGHTAVIHNTNNPCWQRECFELSLPSPDELDADPDGSSLRIEVLDKDYAGNDDMLGEMKINAVDMLNKEQLADYEFDLFDDEQDKMDLVKEDAKEMMEEVGDITEGADEGGVREASGKAEREAVQSAGEESSVQQAAVACSPTLEGQVSGRRMSAYLQADPAFETKGKQKKKGKFEKRKSRGRLTLRFKPFKVRYGIHGSLLEKEEKQREAMRAKRCAERREIWMGNKAPLAVPLGGLASAGERPSTAESAASTTAPEGPIVLTEEERVEMVVVYMQSHARKWLAKIAAQKRRQFVDRRKNKWQLELKIYHASPDMDRGDGGGGGSGGGVDGDQKREKKLPHKRSVDEYVISHEQLQALGCAHWYKCDEVHRGEKHIIAMHYTKQQWRDTFVHNLIRRLHWRYRDAPAVAGAPTTLSFAAGASAGAYPPPAPERTLHRADHAVSAPPLLVFPRDLTRWSLSDVTRLQRTWACAAGGVFEFVLTWAQLERLLLLASEEGDSVNLLEKEQPTDQLLEKEKQGQYSSSGDHDRRQILSADPKRDSLANEANAKQLALELSLVFDPDGAVGLLQMLPILACLCYLCRPAEVQTMQAALAIELAGGSPSSPAKPSKGKDKGKEGRARSSLSGANSAAVSSLQLAGSKSDPEFGAGNLVKGVDTGKRFSFSRQMTRAGANVRNNELQILHSMREKVEFIFELFDFGGEGSICYDEMVVLTRACGKGVLKALEVLERRKAAENRSENRSTSSATSSSAARLARGASGSAAQASSADTEAEAGFPYTQEQLSALYQAMDDEMEKVSDDAFLEADDDQSGLIDIEEFVDFVLNDLKRIAGEYNIHFGAANHGK
jgi:hypothetical protein